MQNTVLKAESMLIDGADKSLKDHAAQNGTLDERKKMLRLKYNFVEESRKLLDKLPSCMRFVGKPEILSDTFLETKLASIESDSTNDTSVNSCLTRKDLQ